MLQINNLHATVGDKPILKGLTLALCLAACSEVPAKGEDCAVLAQQRRIGVNEAMAEFKAANPRLKVMDEQAYPSLKDSQKYLELQAKLERIENIYHSRCPEAKNNAPNQ
jgi:hypothetical protein